MNIAILGANSQIAKDTILSFSSQKKIKLFLFVRNIPKFNEWLISSKLDNHCTAYGYSSFSSSQEFHVIINFVGASDPVKVKKIGKDIIKIT